MQGWVRKYIEKSKVLKTKQFPLRYIKFDRESNMLLVYEFKGKDFVLKTTYYDDILHVKTREQITREESEIISGDK